MAEETLSGVTSLSASEVLAFQERIDGAKADLGTARMDIANYRTHNEQYDNAMSAVNAATTAVDGLTAMSSDADADVEAAAEAIAAAETAVAAGTIAAAETAVAAGTMLTDAEKEMLNGGIETAEGDLETARMDIADYRTHNRQYAAAMEAADEATTAVDGLTAMSSDADVEAAEEAIAAAETAVAAGTMLTDAEKEVLNGQIAIAKVDLGDARMEIADYRTHTGQLAAANAAVDAATMAVDALDIHSSDEAVTGADELIAAAKMAVSDGTMLSESEISELEGKIETAEADLEYVKVQVAIRKQGDTATDIVELQGEASGATSDAMAARDATMQALKDAEKYSEMLDVESVNGDSYEAMMNAQKVLDARDVVVQAVMNAEAARKRAKDAKDKVEAIAAEIEAIADGTERKTELSAALDNAIAALDDAIEKAGEEIAYTMGIRDAKNADDSINADGVALKTDVEMVTGTDEDMPMTPKDKGEEVAMAVGGALLPMVPDTVADAATHDGTARRVEHYATPATLVAVTDLPNIDDRTFHDQDSRGMTWAMIVGEGNIRKERLGPDNIVMQLVSITGMDAADVDSSDSPTLHAGGGGNSDGMWDDTDSIDTDDINYRGIQGTVYCLGGADGCSVGTSGANEGKLVGGWSFTPDSLTDRYIANSDDATMYVADTLYAQWGHWLTMGTSGVTTHTYATSAGNTSNLNLGVMTGSETEFETATYTGDAAGMSLHETFDANGDVETTHSGAFTADVELTARFGSAPTLKGTISGFESTSGMNTDSDWEVELQERALGPTAAFTTIEGSSFGVAKGSGQAGDWSTQGYGPAQSPADGDTPAVDHRPSGFFGNFEAHFTDGHAAGAYAAQEE